MNGDELREAAALTGQAAAWPMAAWLRPLPDGRTVKQGFAEVAARARQLQLQDGLHPGGTPLAADDTELARMMRERERRTVGVLAREADEALRAVLAETSAAEIAELMDTPPLRALAVVLRQCAAAAADG